jgi:hypothetical protein
VNGINGAISLPSFLFAQERKSLKAFRLSEIKKNIEYKSMVLL